MLKSHEATEKTDESKDSFESTQKEEERRRSPTPPPARKSPEPSCAICLEQLTNKSFTDSCFHMFCFTCLVEWSKVKPECPLCKKSFNSIVHNVRSFKDYDQYYVKSRLTDDSRQCLRRFHYRTTLTPERLHEGSRIEIFTDRRLESYLSHRMRFAPHSVHSFRMYPSSQPPRRIPSSFRQRVYDENLWVFPSNSNRVRCISPEFFRQNIGCTHRLLPWLNRELLVVMPNNESQITFVIELIMALIVKYEIRSQEFHTLIEPYTGSYTAHFIHEFYNFAVSPYETLESYDQHAQYDIPSLQTYESISSPDSDVIALDYSSSAQNNTTESSRKKKQSHSKKKHSKSSNYKKLKKIILKRNSENNSWETVSNNMPFLRNSEIMHLPNPLELPGPSTSHGIPFIDSSPETTNIDLEALNDVVVDLEANDEDCQVVDVLKPKHERTPEIVELSSDDETPNGIKDIEDKDNRPSISTIDSNDQTSTDHTLIVSDDEVIFLEESQNPQDTNTVNEIIVDKPIDYSLKPIEPVEKKIDMESSSVIIESCSSSNNDSFKQDVAQLIKKHFDDSELEEAKPQRSSVIQSVVRTVNNEETSSSLSPLPKPKKRRAIFLDEESTESCSDGGPVSELDSRSKKFKLKSVVATFTYGHSDEPESSHHSSLHKKHKERKKKKKKHKHRRRINSSDSD